jgi:hypothetical protein
MTMMRFEPAPPLPPTSEFIEILPSWYGMWDVGAATYSVCASIDHWGGTLSPTQAACSQRPVPTAPRAVPTPPRDAAVLRGPRSSGPVAAPQPGSSSTTGRDR